MLLLHDHVLLLLLGRIFLRLLLDEVVQGALDGVQALIDRLGLLGEL